MDVSAQVAAHGGAPFANNAGQVSYLLDDWLRLHGLTERQCVEVLSKSQHLELARAAPVVSGLSFETAWARAARALEASLPNLGDAIAVVCDRTVRFAASTPRRPATFIDNGGNVVVLMNYRGTVHDLLTISHEFGHALQFHLAAGEFVVPILREIGAFRAELALLALLAEEDPELHRSASRAWASDNESYVMRHGAALSRALERPDSMYDYGWNYPIARIIASECDGPRRPEIERAIFLNRASVQGLATFLGCSHNASPSCSGACLQLSSRIPSQA